MKVYTVLNTWVEDNANWDTNIIGVFDSFDKAKKVFDEHVQASLDWLKEEEAPYVSDIKKDTAWFEYYSTVDNYWILENEVC